MTLSALENNNCMIVSTATSTAVMIPHTVSLEPGNHVRIEEKQALISLALSNSPVNVFYSLLHCKISRIQKIFITLAWFVVRRETATSVVNIYLMKDRGCVVILPEDCSCPVPVE